MFVLTAWVKNDNVAVTDDASAMVPPASDCGGDCGGDAAIAVSGVSCWRRACGVSMGNLNLHGRRRARPQDPAVYRQVSTAGRRGWDIPVDIL